MNPKQTWSYVALLRPASFATLPSGLQWQYVEAPWDLAHMRSDLRRSQHRHGVIATCRQLTVEECERFSLRFDGPRDTVEPDPIVSSDFEGGHGEIEP